MPLMISLKLSKLTLKKDSHMSAKAHVRKNFNNTSKLCKVLLKDFRLKWLIFAGKKEPQCSTN